MLELRDLGESGALRACEGVQREVWGGSELEITPASYLKAAVHAGGLVAGAFQKGEMLGFVFGFPSYTASETGSANQTRMQLGQHSHLLAVRPHARGQGVGQALKWFQRAWCLGRGVSVVTWTFDPLQAKNARFNLEHLGASAVRYYPDFYGTLHDELNGELPSDRLLAEWPLNAPHVVALADSAPQLEVDARGRPVQTPLRGQNAQAVHLELPPHFDPQSDPARALEWRLALRQTMHPLMERGYRAMRFVGGGYLLEPPSARAHER